MTSPRTRSLTVWLHGEPVADLTAGRRDRLRLVYRPEVVERLGRGALCLSAALPVRPAPYRESSAERWTEGLLPEGETRTVLEQRFSVRRGDSFALLTALGRDCAGAVSFLPGDAKPPSPGPPERQSAAQVAASIADLPAHPLGVDDQVRISLGGLQAKLLLTRVGDGWGRPTSGTPSTHILKPDPPGFDGLVASEALALSAARLAGVDAAEAELAILDGRPVLVVERYDRRVVAGVVERVHQEDGCQALGVDPVRDKYQRSSDLPTYLALAGVLTDHAADPATEWRRLGAAAVLTVALGNGDAHARNHGFLIENGVVRLAPAYDVAPTVEFVRSRQLGLWIDGQAMLVAITRRHLLREMTAWGMLLGDARDVLEATLEALEVALPLAAAGLPVVDDALVERCLDRVRRLRASPDH